MPLRSLPVCRRGTHRALGIVALLGGALLGAVPAAATLSPVNDPSQFTEPMIVMDFASSSATGLTWGPPLSSSSTDSTFYYDGPLPSPSRYLRSTAQPLTMTFPEPTTQVGFWFGRDDPALGPALDVTVEAFGAAGSLGSVSAAANMNYDMDQFLGFIATEVVLSVEVTYSIPGAVIVVDDVYWAEPIRPPPPPDPIPGDPFALVLLSDDRSVVGNYTSCPTGEPCSSEHDNEVPSAPFADFVVGTVGNGFQDSGFEPTHLHGVGRGEFGGQSGGGFSLDWDSRSDYRVEFEVTTPATLDLSAQTQFASSVRLSEEGFKLFELQGNAGPSSHQDVLYPGRVYLLEASTTDGEWSFAIDIAEQATAVPVADRLGLTLLCLSLVVVGARAARRVTSRG